MKAFSIDLREKIVAAHLVEKISIRQVAVRFRVSKSVVQKLVKQQRVDGDLQPKQRGKPQLSHLTKAETELRELVAEHHDATLLVRCSVSSATLNDVLLRSHQRAKICPQTAQAGRG